MHITPINPAHDIYPASADHGHAMQVTTPTRWLFISGTMGLASHSRVAFGHRPMATTAVIVGTLNSDWLVEVEAIAAA